MGAKSFRRSGVCACCGRLRRALAAACFALALPLWACAQPALTNSDSEAKGAEGAQPQTAVYGFERAATELGLWGGGSLSGTAATGTAEQTRLGLIAFRYARVVSRGENLAFKYTLDVPLAQMSFPSSQAPGAVPNGPAQLAEQRRSITGAGLSPIGFQLNFRRRERVQPFVQASGGFIYFGERVPDSGGARLNFTTDFGGGVQWKAGTRRAWTIGYRYHHVTNDYRVGVHPGFDSNLFYAGFSIFR